MNPFLEMLTKGDYHILDGAMGTLLFAMGLEQGGAPELWNLEQPENILEVHKRYIEAGSEIILTNTFGGTAFRLKLHQLDDRTYEINKAAASIARQAASEAPQPVVVAGSMGPTGELLVPMGEMTFAEAQAAFAEQAQGLADGGADVLWIETMSHLDEVRAAVAGAREVTDLPVTATLSFDTNGRTMMGVTGAEATSALSELNLAAIGANCGNNLPDTMDAICEMRNANPDIPLIAKANAGIPRWGNNDVLVYDGTPEVMAGFAYHVQRMGATLIGGCCGSSPDTIWAMTNALQGNVPPEKLILPQRQTAPDAAQNPILHPRDRKRRRRRR